MVALPMFIYMGLLLDRSGIANQLMISFARLFGGIRGGLAITVTLIGLLLAATTGIIGASVVLLALLGLPVMLNQGYDTASRRRHGLRGRNSRHSHSTEHHAGADGRPHGHERGRPVPRRRISRFAAGRALHPVPPGLRLAKARRSTGSKARTRRLGRRQSADARPSCHRHFSYWPYSAAYSSVWRPRQKPPEWAPPAPCCWPAEAPAEPRRA